MKLPLSALLPGAFLLLAACAKQAPLAVPSYSTPAALEHEPQLMAPARQTISGLPDTLPVLAPVQAPQTFVLPDVLFDLDQASLRPEAHRVIAQAVSVLSGMPQLNAHIDGHTDSTGKEFHNHILSVLRSREVKREMVLMGIDAQRIKTDGLGETRPVASNASPAGRRANRRVEISFRQNPSI